MIQVEGLTKYYGDYKAIDRLSFFADEGEIVGFVGRNGSGKTTTIRVLTGYMPPSEGKAIIAGYDVFEDSLEVRRRIGYLPETVPLYREMSVWQYVEYMANLRGMPRLERKKQVGETLEMVNLYDRRNSLISSLSRGMRQRVGLAQALVHSPKVLIMDEPTVGLDPDQRQEMRALIKAVGQNRTVFLSSHDLAELEKLATRILVIDNGRIIAEDETDTLARRIQAETRFVVRVGGAHPDDVLKLIRATPHVREAYPIQGGVEVVSAADKDARPGVAAAVVNKRWELLELRSSGVSLEEVFMQLTAEPEKAPGEEEN
ncbi:MAG: ABC transporter ATP-binding protein [Anaerolineae bacterium]|nr:ABC transporter ATP-binding protein [Anaerolineae bacterium]